MEERPNSTASRPTPAPANRSLLSEFRFWVRDLFIAVGLAAVIIVFLYQPVKVEGTSMVPMLSDQERIFINKFVYHFEAIQRGDIVVFWYPMDRTKSFIKRVVGLPGETIEIRRGHVFINGRELHEPYMRPEFYDNASYPATRISPNHYYVLGDHRSSSNDSRMWGTVDTRYVYGKAVFCYWPFDKIGSLETTPNSNP